MKKVGLLFTLLISCLIISAPVQAKERNANQMELSLNGQTYQVATEHNATAQALKKQLPLTVQMKELNGNEKYHYFNHHLPANDHKVKHIKKGDLMLYDGKCLVLFYKDFSTPYQYTRIGHVENFDQVANKLGKQSIKITLRAKDN